MADYFVDDSVVGGGDDGTDWDTNAFNTGGNYGLVTAMESTGYTTANNEKIWIRRTSDYLEAVAGLNSDITIADDGTALYPLRFIGWPRASKVINCDWVNGSTTVDNVDSNDMVRGEHQGRYITGPDGFVYLITDITDTNTFIIDREYAGSTAANENVTISADEDYATRPDVGGLRAAWDADADDLPIIDFNNEAYLLNGSNDVLLLG